MSWCPVIYSLPQTPQRCTCGVPMMHPCEMDEAGMCPDSGAHRLVVWGVSADSTTRQGQSSFNFSALTNFTSLPDLDPFPLHNHTHEGVLHLPHLPRVHGNRATSQHRSRCWLIPGSLSHVKHVKTSGRIVAHWLMAPPLYVPQAWPDINTSVLQSQTGHRHHEAGQQGWWCYSVTTDIFPSHHWLLGMG